VEDGPVVVPVVRHRVHVRTVGEQQKNGIQALGKDGIILDSWRKNLCGGFKQLKIPEEAWPLSSEA
jgi:hypothetical protein